MNLWKLILTWTLLLAPIYSTKESIKQNTDQEIMETFLNMPISYKISSKEDFQNLKIDSADIQSWKKIIITRHFDDKEKDPASKMNPLFMNWTPKYIWSFLWYNQSPYIMQNYNNSTSITCKPLDSIPDISFPLIYDGLLDKLPNDLDSLLSQDKFSKYKNKLSWIDSLIVVAKQKNWEYTLSYYIDGRLVLASESSIWAATQKWLFDIKEKIERKRSSRYDNAPMPYSLYLYGHVFIHQWLVNWEKISHGCVRMPGLYQEVLYHNTKVWTKVLIVL